MFKIGDKLTKENYTQGAIWCNTNNAMIVKEGSECFIRAIPEPLPPTNEEIKAERERLYVLYADKLKNDYDEDVARYGLESSEALASKKIWLDKKDEIRENNPYNDADEEI